MSKKSDRKPKFPKSVAGVRVPKNLRKPAAKIAAAATSPAGLELIAAALSVAAAVATTAVERERAKRRPNVGADGDAKREPASGPQPPRASNDPHDVGVALGRMAEAALTGLFRPRS